MVPKLVLARLTTFLMVLACVLLTVIPAAAQEQTEKRGRRQTQWWTSDKVTERLALSVDQMAQIVDIEQGTNAIRQEAARNQRQAYREVILGLAHEDLPEEELEQRVKALEQASIESTRVTVDYWQRLRAVLSQEQWQELPRAAPRVLRLGGMITRGFQRVDVAGAEENTEATPKP